MVIKEKRKKDEANEENSSKDADVFAAKSEEYAARIVKLQEEYLIPLKEDLSDWLNRILVIDGLNAETFMDKLDNGVLICKLAKIIEETCEIDLNQAGSLRSAPSIHNYRSTSVCSSSSSASSSASGGASFYSHPSGPSNRSNKRILPSSEETRKVGATNGNISDSKEKNEANEREKKLADERKGHAEDEDNDLEESKKRKSPLMENRKPKAREEMRQKLVFVSARKMKCWENAKSESFYARDNVSNFINWARALGVRDAVAFETEDLVLHNNPRNVVLCLLEVARIACNKYSFSPAPGLVQFEREIDQEIEKEEAEGHCIRTIDEKEASNSDCNEKNRSSSLNCCDSAVASADDEADGWSSVSQDNFGRTPSVTSISSTSVGSSIETPSAIYGSDPSKATSQLDQKVMLIAKSYYGKKVKHGVQRLAEGKYRIAGKIVFVRLLKDKHVMVRVGGGWDTLQHFLERHGGDTMQDISPSDLLPMDTRPTESTSRRRSSQSSLQNVSTTPVLRRCISSTPVSRSTMSSPEPWMSGSSGYSSGSGGGTKMQSRPLSRRGSICTASLLEKSHIPVQSRRKSLGLADTAANRASLNLPLSKAVSSNGISTAPSSPTRPLSAIEKTSRYPNYLQSSQHITSRTTGARSVSTRNPVVRRTSLRAF